MSATETTVHAAHHATAETLTPAAVRRNFWCFFADGAGFPLGLVFLSVSTIMPLFVSQLTHSRFLIGLVASVFALGVNAPGLIGAHLAERLPRKKPLVVILTALERLSIIGIVPATLLLADRPGTLLAVFFIAWALFTLTLGVNFPGFSALLGKSIPTTLRGRLGGWGAATSGFFGFFGALAATRLLEWQPFPHGFFWCFLIGNTFLVVSAFPIIFVREQADVPAPLPAFHRFVRSAFDHFRQDRRLRWFVISQAFYYFYWMGSAFYAVYALDRFGASRTTVANFNVVQVAAAVIFGFVCGHLSDRFGNRAILRLAMVAAVVAPVIALLARNPIWLWGCFICIGLMQTGGWFAPFNLLLELAPPRLAPTYTALWRLLVVPAAAGSPLLAGLIVERFGYTPMFVIAAALPVVGLLALTKVPEPRKHAYAAVPLAMGE